MITRDQVSSLGFVPLGFDLETSTGDPCTGSILSIGAVDNINDREFYCELKYDELVVEPEALRVNGMDITRMDSNKDGVERLRPSVADVELTKFLQGKRYVPVGFNVIQFDMAYVSACLPKAGALLGSSGNAYPIGIDLNTLCMTRAMQELFGWKGIKKRIKSEAAGRLRKKGVDVKDHHAMYDAMMALECLDILMEMP